MQNSMHLFLDSWVRGGHMMDMGRGFGFFPAGFVGLLSLVALILLAIWAVRSWSNNRQIPATAGATAQSMGATPSVMATPNPVPTTKTPLDVVQMRYARGEISRAEYDTIRNDILRDQPTTQDVVYPVAATADVSNDATEIITEDIVAAAPSTDEGIETAGDSNETIVASEPTTQDDDEPKREV